MSINSYRAEKRRPDEVYLNDVPDFSLTGAWRPRSGGRRPPPETEALDGIPDAEVKTASSRFPSSSAWP